MKTATVTGPPLPTTLCFGNLAPGDFFSYQGDLYRKTALAGYENNAVLLRDGKSITFSGSNAVGAVIEVTITWK